MSTRKLRKINNKEELKKYRRMSRYAFFDWKDKDVKEDLLGWYEDNVKVFGVYEKQDIASGLVLHNFEQIVRGNIKKMYGIGDVATYPEYRRKGYITRLMKKSFEVMKEDNVAVSMLLPFKETFYEKYDYVSTNNNINVKFDLKSFEHYKDYKAFGNWKEIRKEMKDAKMPFLNLMRKVAQKKCHGAVLYDKKIENLWKIIMKNCMFVFIKKSNEIVAGARYTKKGFPDTGKICVKEMYWVNKEARNMLFKYFAKHIDQVKEIKFFVPLGVNFYSWVKDNKNIKIEGEKNPWMVRIMNVKKALKKIKVNEEGALIIKVKDKKCGWNNGIYKLKAENKKMGVVKSKEKPDVAVDIKALTSLLYGAYDYIETKMLFDIKIENKKSEKLLKSWFDQKFLYNNFHF